MNQDLQDITAVANLCRAILYQQTMDTEQTCITLGLTGKNPDRKLAKLVKLQHLKKVTGKTHKHYDKFEVWRLKEKLDTGAITLPFTR